MGWLPDPLAFLKYTAMVAGVSVISVGGLLYNYQCSLIYPSNLPAGSRTNVPTPADFGMPYEEVSLVTPDGVRLKAFLILAGEKAEARPTILLLHANAGNVVRTLGGASENGLWRCGAGPERRS